MSSIIDYIQDRELIRKNGIGWQSGLRSNVQKYVNINHLSAASPPPPEVQVEEASAPQNRGPTFSQSSIRWHPSVIRKFNFIQNLVGHRGCVNRLNWNRHHTIMASGSDDLRIMLWKYRGMNFADSDSEAPFSVLGSLKTSHTRNIFGVQFLDDFHIVSGAMDGEVRIHALESSTDHLAPRAPISTSPAAAFSPPLLPAVTTRFTCHRRRRVKDVEVDPSSPFLYWSASEDQTIRQFDTRHPHSCVASGCNNAVIFAPAEFKSVSVSRSRPNYLCAGAGDSLVRIYDRRMLSAKSRHAHSLDPTDHSCVRIFSSLRYSAESPFTTHVSWSRDGHSVLANFNGGHLYEFGFDQAHDTLSCYTTPLNVKSSSSSSSSLTSDSSYSSSSSTSTSTSSSSDTSSSSSILPSDISSSTSFIDPSPSLLCCRLCSIASAERLRGNEFFQNAHWSNAIHCYTSGIEVARHCGHQAGLISLLTNRAGVFLRRKWMGDAEAALRDCNVVLHFDPVHSKALYRKAKALSLLSEDSLALKIAHQGHALYPSHTQFRSLLDKLEASLSDRDVTPLSPDDEDEVVDPLDTSLFVDSATPDAPLDDDSSQSDDGATQSNVSFAWRRRFVGHLNSSTDIKEAFFFGDRDQYVMTGSDEGYLFVWDRLSTALLLMLPADENVCNSLKAHPTDPLIVSSGIESVIKVWGPDGQKQFEPSSYLPHQDIIKNNQNSLLHPQSPVSLSEILTMFPATQTCTPQ